MSENMLFGIDYYEIAYEDEDLMILDAYVCSKGKNRHDTYFEEKNIINAIPSLANKPLICMWNEYEKDFKEHARTEGDSYKQLPVGNIPETNKAEIVDYKDKRFLKCAVIVWKDYMPKMAKKLASNEKTEISMEIEIFETKDMNNGLVNITDFKFKALCLLGEKYMPAIEDANVNVVKFSEGEYDEYNEKREKYNKLFSLKNEENAEVENINKDKRKGLCALNMLDMLSFMDKSISEKEKDEYGYPKYMLEDVNEESKMVYVVCYEGGCVKYYMLPYAQANDKYEMNWEGKEEVYPNREFVKVENEAPKSDNYCKLFSRVEEIQTKNVEIQTELTSKSEEIEGLQTEISKVEEDKKAIEGKYSELKIYKETKESDELKDKIDKVYAKYSEFLSEEEKKDFDEKAKSVSLNDFDDKFKNPLYACVLPKVEKLVNEEKQSTETETEEENISTNFTANLPNDEAESNKNSSLAQKLKNKYQ